MRWVALVALLGCLGASAPANPAPIEEAWAGRWAMELRLASVAKLPLLPSQRSTTVSWMLVDLERGAEGWTQRHRVCDVRVEGTTGGVRMTIPQAFVQALPERRYPVALRHSSNGWSYAADMGLETIGLHEGFADAELPRTAGHPSVRDTDRDGAPGATVEMVLPVVGRTRLYIVQRSHLVLSGGGAAAQHVQGSVDIRLQEQRTVGADPGMFRRSPAIRPDADRSKFILARMPRGATCAELRNASLKLFREQA